MTAAFAESLGMAEPYGAIFDRLEVEPSHLCQLGYLFREELVSRVWATRYDCSGAICVVTRWRDAENREQRVRLIWTQALHWIAVLLAMHLMYVADVGRMMNADASALAH
jgi:hypothetical protein